MNVFITGVSKGIGRELVKQLVKNGHTVWGISRSDNLLRALAREVGKDRFFYTVCDVSNENDVKKTMIKMKRYSFIPDVIILNAAIFHDDMKPYYSNRILLKTFTVNLFGALTWVEKFLPDFLTRGGGHFIASSSTSAFRPDFNSVSLPASKAALSMAFRSLRLRYTSENIIFSTVHFGPVATGISPKYVSLSGGPKYPFVLTTSQAAGYMQRVIKERKPKDYFFPFVTTLAFRLTLFFPDSFFAMISRILKR